MSNTVSPPAESDARVVRLGGLSALASGVVFLITIAYTFGFLATRGLTTDLLNAPAQLLPWVNANTIAWVELWWIFTTHLVLLLPVPAALAIVAGSRRAGIRVATTAGVSGAIVGMAAAMVIAATAPALGRAAVNNPPALLPNVLLVSELMGSFALHLRLVSYLLFSVWLTITGLALLRTPGWRALSVAQLAVSALTLVVLVEKPFDVLDLEPSLGFVFALVYLWLGVKLLRAT